MTYPISASLIYKTDDLNVQIKIEVLELLGQAVYLYMIERPLPLSTMHCHCPPCTAIVHHALPLPTMHCHYPPYTHIFIWYR